MTVAEALEELFSTEPSEFTKKRDALAKDFKKAGDKEGAAAIAAKRKPTQIAYVLNQLARKHPDAIADLVDVGRELMREQRRALRGEASHGLRDSIDRQRKAITDVGQKAAAVMKSLGVDPMAHLQEVTIALQAALIDPAVGAALEAGQLEKAPEAAVGFGGPMASAPAAAESEPARAAAPKKKEPKSEPEREDDSEAEEKEKARAAKEAEAEKQRARAAHAKSVSEAKAVLKAAEAEADRARAAAAEAATEAEAAELVLAKAKEAAAAAAKEAKRLAAEVTTAERTVAAAEKAVRQLEADAP